MTDNQPEYRYDAEQDSRPATNENDVLGEPTDQGDRAPRYDADTVADRGLVREDDSAIDGQDGVADAPTRVAKNLDERNADRPDNEAPVLSATELDEQAERAEQAERLRGTITDDEAVDRER